MWRTEINISSCPYCLELMKQTLISSDGDIPFENVLNQKYVCMECSINFAIKTNWYKQCMQSLLIQDSNYMSDIMSMCIYGPQQNYLICKKISNNKQLFNNLFSYFGSLLLYGKNNETLKEFVATHYHAEKTYSLLSKFLLTFHKIKRKHIRWIFKSNLDIMVGLLSNCCQIKCKISYIDYLNWWTTNNVPLSDVEIMWTLAISDCIDLIMWKLEEYNMQCKNNLVQKFQKINKFSFHQYLYETMPQFIRHQSKLRYNNGRSAKYDIAKKDLKCGNAKCEHEYWKYKHGFQFDKLDHYIKQKNWAILKQKRKKWYKCSGCRLVYYCSKRCQKYAWNSQRHKLHCLYIQKHLIIS